jgi:hypothetical protein
MNGGTYTLTPISTQPSPEVVIEYVPPPNTPAAPVITSTTHGESGTWSNKNSAELRWTLPAGVSAVRTLLDTSPSSVPTKVYDTPISSITLNDLADGISYFHLQFQNADGWGRIGRYRFAVDTKPLPIFTVQRDETIDQTNPIQTVLVTFPEHTGAPITRYEYTINGGDVIVVDDSEQKRQFTLPALAPGNYTIVVTAFNAAGSSALSTYNFSIKTFSAPRIENIPERINERTLPVIQGVSAPGATVTLTLTKGNAEPRRFVAIADENGAYSVIVDEALTRGVYTVTLSAVDANGAESDVSNPRQLIVEEPGYMTIGSYMVNVLSVVLSLVSLTVMTLLVALYGMRTFARFRKRVGKEAAEMLIIMQKEFKNVQRVLAEEAELVVRSRKTKQLTKAEQHLIDTVNAVLVTAEKNITKEATDVANLVDKDTIS